MCSRSVIDSQFQKAYCASRKSIHIPIRIQGMTSIALIDYGATGNFINLAFMRKRGLEPTPLDQTNTCKLGEVMMEVTHGYQAVLGVEYKRIHVDIFVTNGKSSQVLVLGYTLLAENDDTVNFKSKELRLGRMNAHCLSSQREEPAVRQRVEDKGQEVMELENRWGLLSNEDCWFWPGETRVITLKTRPEEWSGRHIAGRKYVTLVCGVIDQWNGQA